MRLMALVLCLIPASAHAKDFVKSAKSGQTTTMANYRSWNKECKSKLGIVKVLSKPAHGTLTPVAVESVIPASRVTPEITAHCKGAPIIGFRVDYTPVSGYRGTDQFQLQFFYGRNVDIDNFTVNVQ